MAITLPSVQTLFAMTRPFSTYLDCIRFLAAMVVFLGHAAGKYWTAGFLWPLSAYGDTCVVVFFVLSGFVIAYVCDTKERDWQVYSANRIARLWSVVLPALLLTVVIDYFGVRVAPQLYWGQPWYGADHLSLRYLASVFMLQEAWHADLLPGTNKPLWSLSYEAIYYLAIGCILFVRGWARWVWCLLALLLGGPLIAALFPIWGFGYAAYFLCKRWAMPVSAAVAVFLATIGLLVLSPTLRHMLPFDWHVLGEPVQASISTSGNITGRILTGAPYCRRHVKNRCVLRPLANATEEMDLLGTSV